MGMQLQKPKAGAGGDKADCTVKDKHHLSRYSMGCMPLRAMLATIASATRSASQPIPAANAISGFSFASTCLKHQCKSAQEVETRPNRSSSRACWSSCLG